MSKQIILFILLTAEIFLKMCTVLRKIWLPKMFNLVIQPFLERRWMTIVTASEVAGSLLYNNKDASYPQGVEGWPEWLHYPVSTVVL